LRAPTSSPRPMRPCALSVPAALSYFPLPSTAFSSNDPPPIGIHTLSLHDALPIFAPGSRSTPMAIALTARLEVHVTVHPDERSADRKSTRLNSSHVSISYAVFCLKKKSLISQSWK